MSLNLNHLFFFTFFLSFKNIFFYNILIHAMRTIKLLGCSGISVKCFKLLFYNFDKPSAFPWTCSGTLLGKNVLGQLLAVTTVEHMALL